MFTNAQNAIVSVNPDLYAYTGSYKTSYNKTTNRTRGNIRETHNYSTEQTAIVEVNITESEDQNNCSEKSYSIDGEISGRCFVGGGAMADAEASFSNYSVSNYSSYGKLISSRITKTEKRGKIRFSYEFRDTSNTYDHEQLVSVRTDDQDSTKEIVVSGTITPFCGGASDQVTNGLAAWDDVSSNIQSIASSECGGIMTLKTTSVSKNKRNGQIQYSYTYLCGDNSCVSGAIKESINITHDAPADVFVEIPIIGRVCGPFIQDKNTKTAERCTVAIDLLFPRNSGCSYTKPTANIPNPASIISSLGYCLDGSKIEKDTDSWNPRTGRYTRTYSVVCVCCN
jgi:hypothetical protein